MRPRTISNHDDTILAMAADNCMYPEIARKIGLPLRRVAARGYRLGLRLGRTASKKKVKPPLPRDVCPELKTQPTPDDGAVAALVALVERWAA